MKPKGLRAWQQRWRQTIIIAVFLFHLCNILRRKTHARWQCDDFIINWCTFEQREWKRMTVTMQRLQNQSSDAFCTNSATKWRLTQMEYNRYASNWLHCNRVIKEISIQSLQLKWTPYSFTCCRMRVAKKQHHCFKIRWIVSLDHVKCWMSSSIPVAAAAWLRFYIFLRCSSHTTLAFKFNSN